MLRFLGYPVLSETCYVCVRSLKKLFEIAMKIVEAKVFTTTMRANKNVFGTWFFSTNFFEID